MKAVAMKTKRGTALKDTQKGKSTKLKKCPPTRLIKSTPGFSLYSGDEVGKSASKSKESDAKVSQGPRLINGDVRGVVSHDDDIVSQVQLVESKNKESRLNDVPVDRPNTHNNTKSTSPDLTGNPGLSEVRTPFNKRLISSTPDPERLFSIHDHGENVVLPKGNINADNPLANVSPQLVPEKDTETDSKSTKSSTFDIIGSLLMTQRQNQMLWQQQLEQFKQPPPVIKVSNRPSHSAFQQWKGLDEGVVNDNGENFVLLPQEIRHDIVGQENHHKAEWVAGDASQSDTEPAAGKVSERNRKDLSAEKHVDPSSYNAYGTTSERVVDSVQMKNNDAAIVGKFPLQNKDSVVVDAMSGSERQPVIKKKVVGSKSKEERSNSQNKWPVSSRVSSKASTFEVKVLPVSTRNAQESSRDQTKSSVHRKVVNRKQQQMNKVSTVVEMSEPVKKKKILHISLPRDERGTDVPPSFSVDDDDDDEAGTTSSPQTTENDAKEFINDSVSVCGEEVNSVLSKESEKSGDNHTVESSTAMGKQSTLSNSPLFSSNADIDVAYTLTDKDVIELKIRDDFETNVSYSGKNLNQNQNSTDDYLGKEVAEQNPLPLVQDQDYKIEEKGKVSALQEADTVEKLSGSESDEVNINQNHHGYDDERERQRSKCYRLHFLEKMADKTLMDIVCKLNLKATAIGDTELRDLIDDMIYNTDATLAREDGRLRSSQAFFMEENGRLKKRLHNVNKQLETKERQERQADLYPGVSNNDVMHLERKNLYLRQEKDRLDNQVTNLLEEKAKWLVKQQDLVKTISLKDREILKLEGKFQEEKKTLHKAVDEAAKNSQGVHFKLSVADREIANLEQRVKTKDREITDLKDALKDAKDDLQCCVDGRTEKNREITRLQGLVDTLKVGVNEVMKAYEATAYTQPSTSEQRQGIDSLRRLVTDSLSAASSMSHIPEQVEASVHRRRQHDQSYHEHNGRAGGAPFSTSTRLELPPHHQQPLGQQQAQWRKPSQQQQQQQQQRHKQIHQESTTHKQQQQQQQALKRDRQIIPRDGGGAQRSPHRSTHRADTDDGVDWYAQDSSLLKSKDRGGRPRHDSGSALTVRAVEDHNRRLSPIDRTLWHSLDTGHVMPPFTGEEPYHSDSEIHVANSRTRRRMDQERLDDIQARGTLQQRGHNRRKSDDFTDRTAQWNGGQDTRQSNTDRLNRLETFDDRRGAAGQERRREREWSKGSLGHERMSRGYNSGVRDEPRNGDTEPGGRRVDERESMTLNNEDIEGDIDRSRYSVSDYFRKYPTESAGRYPPSSQHRDQQQEQSDKRYPMYSKDYWLDSGTADDPDQDETISRQRQHQGHSVDRTRSFQQDDRFPSLESMSVSVQTNVPSSSRSRDKLLSPTEGSEDYHKSSQRQQQQQYLGDEFAQRSIMHGKLVQNPGAESQSRHEGSTNPNPLSSSYPTLRSEGVTSSDRQPSTALSSGSHFPSLLSTSLPASSHQRHSDRSRRREEDEMDLSHGLGNRPPPLQQDYRSIEVDDRKQGGNDRPSHRYMEKSLEDGRHVSSMSRSHQPSVTFRDPSIEDSLPNQPSQSFQSDFRNGRTSFPPHSSPVTTSDISISRRATRGSETSQQDFFRGTELSASCSSISDTDLPHHDYSTNNNPNVPAEYGEESFNTGIASLDSKIAELEAKINRTKAVFS